MHHFFVLKEQVGEREVCITGTDVNHIKQVLRMKVGEQVLVSNGEGIDYLCSIVKIEPNGVFCEILERKEEDRELPIRIFLFQGMAKGEKMELIIQKAVELGAFCVVPVNTTRTVVKLDQKKEESKLKRWNLIAESAAKQSKRMMIPKVESVMSFSQVCKVAKEFDFCFLAYEDALDMSQTKQLFTKIRVGMKIGVFIGPEGGFDEKEVALAKESGVHIITLGKRILRTETAGLALLSILMFQLES